MIQIKLKVGHAGQGRPTRKDYQHLQKWLIEQMGEASIYATVEVI